MRHLEVAYHGAPRFVEHRAGVPYGDAIYTQALVANTVGQEMSAFSVVSEDYGRLGVPRRRAAGNVIGERSVRRRAFVSL